MSRAYRNWKERIKAYMRGELPKIINDDEILTCSTSMASYKKRRAIRQKFKKKVRPTLIWSRFQGGMYDDSRSD